MWGLITGRFGKYLVVVLIGAGWAIGHVQGASKQHNLDMAAQQAATDKALRQAQQAVTTATTKFHQEKESDLILYRNLQYANQTLRDNLSACKLSNKRVQYIYIAAKLPIPTNTGGTNAAIAGITANSEGDFSCADLQATATAWAESYGLARNIATRLQDIVRSTVQ